MAARLKWRMLTWPSHLLPLTVLPPTLTLWAVNRYATYFPAPISTRADLYRVTASVPLIVLLLLGAVVLGVGQPAPATPLTYLSLLNPMDVALLVLFVVVLGWFNQRLDRSGRERTFNLGVYALVGLCAFLFDVKKIYTYTGAKIFTFFDLRLLQMSVGETVAV